MVSRPESARSITSAGRLRCSRRARISAAVVRLPGRSSQRPARQTARISRPSVSSSRAAQSLRTASTLPGANAQIAAPGKSNSPTPVSTAIEPHGSPTQKASISPAAMASAIKGGGTVRMSIAGAPGSESQ